MTEYAGADFPLQEGIGSGWKDECRPETALSASCPAPQETGLWTGKRCERQNQKQTNSKYAIPKKRLSSTRHVTLTLPATNGLEGVLKSRIDAPAQLLPQTSATESFLRRVISTYPFPSTHCAPAKTECKIEMNKLRVSLADPLDLFCGNYPPASTATRRAQPSQSADRAYTGSGHNCSAAWATPAWEWTKQASE